MQPVAIYNSEFADANGVISKENSSLDFSKANHYVFGYEHMFRNDIHFKTEFYYQHLYNVPVSADITSTYSVLNSIWDYHAEALVNKPPFGISVMRHPQPCI